VYKLIKLYTDYIISLVLIVLLFPVLVVIPLLTVISSGFPVFFRQLRPGKNGKPFRIYKFRTMNNKKDQSGCLLPDFERLTPIGLFLRKTSIDELPELLNILKGEMSVVGPRPLLMQYLDRYTPEQSRRHEVKPGITGWAQVNGRNELIWEEKFKLDVWYVDHMCFKLDMKIIWMTLIKVLKREGINAPGQATMEEFSRTKNLK
jgi:sugar transferase EpsL